MTWAAQIIDRTDMAQGIEVAVVLSDGTQKFVQRFQTNGSLADLTAKVKNAVAQQDARKVVDEVPIGLVLDLSPDIIADPVPPSAEQIAQDAWAASYDALLQLERGVARGWIDANDPEVVALNSTLSKTFDPAYRGLL